MTLSLLLISALTVSNEGPAKTVQVMSFDRPNVKGSMWLVRGKVRYQGVEGQAYLETWNTVAGRDYFSRDFFTGSSEWREFSLPFDATSVGVAPEKVVLNVVLPGKGTVEIDRVELVDLEGGFSRPHCGLIIGMVGSLLGVTVLLIRRRIRKSIA